MSVYWRPSRPAPRSARSAKHDGVFADQRAAAQTILASQAIVFGRVVEIAGDGSALVQTMRAKPQRHAVPATEVARNNLMVGALVEQSSNGRWWRPANTRCSARPESKAAA